MIVDRQLDTRDLGETDRHGCVKTAFAGDQLVLSLAEVAHQERLENPVSVDGGLEILEITEVRARLILVAGDGGDADHAADTLPHPLGELVDEVPIVAHPTIGWKTHFGFTRSRHAGEPPRTDDNTRRRRWTTAHG